MPTQQEIERGKALFLPDYQRMERSLEAQFANPNLSVQEKAAISDKLMRLKFWWQEEGASNLNVLRSIRDTLAGSLVELGEAGLATADNQVFTDYSAKLAEVEKLISQARAAGVKEL